MKGRLTKNIKTTIYIAPGRIFVTFGLVIFIKFESKSYLKLCKFRLPKEILYDICKCFFNICLSGVTVSNEWTITIC